MPDLKVPSATYRLQLHHGFPFTAAQSLVPYLNDLGISELYASPFFKARRRSMHGYSVTNPLEINPELGSRASFNALSRALKSRGMGLLLDIVPNHMALSHDNPWWLDVLEDGPGSPYAVFFDIDWQPPHRILDGTVLQPILGAPYAQALEGRELWLTLEEGGFCVHYYDHKFPLDPKTYVLILSHRIDTLSLELGDENPAILILKGLISLSEHLPSRMVSSKKRLQERQRQKEILKKNLWTHYEGNSIIKKFIDENLAIFNGTTGDPDSFNLLDSLLRLQPYRLAWWQVALHLINYRRFFSVNDLIGLRVEDPLVFEASHSLLFSLVRDGRISGLRIDHVDGLFDPGGYLRRLQDRLGEVQKALTADARNFYVVVEKILEEDEPLPPEWSVAGTTGYDYLGQVNGLFVEPQGLAELQRIYVHFTQLGATLPEVMYDKKKLVMETLFGGELEALAHQLAILAEQDRQARDIARDDIHLALKEIIACLPRYRTYIRSLEVASQDRCCLEQGFAAGLRKNPALNPLAVDFLRRVLFLDFPSNLPQDRRKDWLQFVMKWQQFTGPIMAKGLEDTASYVYNPLVSLNEVGGSFQAISPQALHRFNQERLESWPHSLNATSTHDTKRSEDVRMRIHVLTEIPGEWEACLKRWSSWNQSKKKIVQGVEVPDANEEYFLYQTLMGAWPLGGADMTEFQERLKAYVIKAAREAKVHTRWIAPNHEHEDALLAFVEAILTETADNDFLADLQKFHSWLAYCGALKSLSQVVLKITSPGVPDFYQGTELWDFSLVDPDNRRPVDFSQRIELLKELRRREGETPAALVQDLLLNWENGAIKLYLTYKALNFRKAHPDLFSQGDYIPLMATGPKEDCVVAFARRWENTWLIVGAGRFFSRILSPGSICFPKEVWEESFLALPEEAPKEWWHILTGETVTSTGGGQSRLLATADLFNNFPVALLWSRAEVA